MHMCTSGHSVKCFTCCRLKKIYKNYYSKEEEIAVFLFNKFDSLLALFIQRQCHCFWEGRVILDHLILESHPDYSRIISDSGVFYQYFHTFHWERCKKHCQAEVMGNM